MVVVVAVDTNVLLDIALPDQSFVEESYRLLSFYMQQGSLVICDLVYSELASVFDDFSVLDGFLSASNIRLVPNSEAVLRVAGQTWRLYTQGRAKSLQYTSTRQHIISDFLIGAHALENADRLLTRDRGIFARYFPNLTTQAKL